MRNPDWNREELILALDLYFQLDYGQMHGKNPRVIQLSEELRTLNIHKNISDRKSFRSVNSVALKLANLKKSDQNFKGKGMKDGGSLEKELWKEFHRHRDKLKKEADIIRQLHLGSSMKTKPVVSEARQKYHSEFLFQVHKNRESDPVIIKMKKEVALTNSNSLKCEVCGFDSVTFYGELGNNLIELHYIKELDNTPEPEVNDVKDFALVCGNCHKVLDRNLGVITIKELKKLIRKK